MAKLSADLELNISGFVNELKKVSQQVSNIADGVALSVKADTRQAKKNLQDLSKNKPKLDADTSNIDKKIGGIGSKLKEALGGSNLGGAFLSGGAIAAGVGAVQALAGAAGQAFEEFKNLDTAVKNIGTLGVENFEEFAELSTELSRKVPESAAGIANAAYQAVSAGISGTNEEILGFVQQAAQVGVAGLATTEDAVNGLTSVLNAYGKETSQAGEVSDTFFAAIKLGKTSFNEINAGLANVVPAASAAGVSFDEVAAGIAQMTALGVPTAQATTQMRAAIIELQKPGKPLAEAMEAAGLSVANIGEEIKSKGLIGVLQQVEKGGLNLGKSMTQIFSSSEAASAGLLFTGKNAERANKTLAAVRKEIEGGASTKAYETAAQGLDVQFKIIGNNIQGIFNDLFTGSGTILGEGLQFITGFIQQFVNDFKEIFGSLSSDAKAIFQAIGGLVVGNLVTTFEVAREAITTAFEIIIDIFNGLGEAFSPIIESVQELFGSFDSGGSVLETFRNVLSEVFDVVSLVANLIIAVFVEGLKNAFSFIGFIVSALFDFVGISDAASNSTLSFQKVIDFLKNSLTNVKGTIGGVTESFKSIQNVIRGTLEALASFNLTRVKEILTGAGDEIAKAYDDGFNKATKTVKEETEEIKQEVDSTGEKIETKIPESTKKAAAGASKELKKIQDNWKKVQEFLLSETVKRTDEELAIEAQKEKNKITLLTDEARKLQDQIKAVSGQETGNQETDLQNEINSYQERIRLIQNFYDVKRQIEQTAYNSSISQLNAANQKELDSIKQKFDEQRKLAAGNSELIERLNQEEKQAISNQNVQHKLDLEEIENGFTIKLGELGSKQKEEVILADKERTEAQAELSNLRMQKEEEELALRGSLAGQAKGLFRQNTAAYKALAIAEATIATYLGANKAIGQGGIFGVIQAAIIIASGLQNIAKISGVGFKTGGYTGNGSADEVAGVVHKKEFVHTAETTKKYRGLFEHMQDGKNPLQWSGFQFELGAMLANNKIALPVDKKPNINENLQSKQIQAAIDRQTEILRKELWKNGKLELHDKRPTSIKIENRISSVPVWMR